MSDYRRYFVPGGTYFFTLVAHQRRARFAEPEDLRRLRSAVAFVQREQPFRFVAAVVLPDHMHFIWTLPQEDSDYSRRIGRMKVHFTKSCQTCTLAGEADLSSRHGRRENTVWQRRFWEHTIRDEAELHALLDYIHYNPVKHGLARCPHEWPASSFWRWVARGLHDCHWGCQCRNGAFAPPDFRALDRVVGDL